MWLGKSRKCISIEELMQHAFKSIAEKSAAHDAAVETQAVQSRHMPAQQLARVPLPSVPGLSGCESWWGRCSRCRIQTTHAHPWREGRYCCPPCAADPGWVERARSTAPTQRWPGLGGWKWDFGAQEPDRPAVPLPGGCGSINVTSLSSFNKRSRRRSRRRRSTRRRSTRRRSTRRRSTRRLRSRTARSRKSKSRVRRRRSRHKKH